MSVDAALGCRARIFNVQKTGKSGVDKSASNVSVNMQASSFVCKHVLDALAALAKNFPASFTPQHVPSCPMYGSKDEPPINALNEAEFWSILVRLDGTYGGKKGKVSARNTSSNTPVKNTGFNASPIGYLMSLLSHPVIRKNANLMDSLLRLLSVISASLPDNANQPKTSPSFPSNEQNPAADVIRPTTPSNQSTASTGRAQTPESVTSSLVVETSPRGLEPETDSVDSGPTAASLPQEPMDVEIHSVTSSVSDSKTQSLDVVPSDDVISGTVVMAPQLKLAAEVLTSGACSEDGLEDATTLLLQVTALRNTQV
jgi:E3 ubiquitin-protein ligase HUWE1